MDAHPPLFFPGTADGGIAIVRRGGKTNLSDTLCANRPQYANGSARLAAQPLVNVADNSEVASRAREHERRLPVRVRLDVPAEDSTELLNRRDE